MEHQEASSIDSEISDAMLHTIGALVVVLDKDGKIVLFNQACETTSGYTEQDALGNSPWDFLLPEDIKDAVKGVFSRLVSGDFPNSYENAWVSKQGELRHISWSNTAISNADGGVKYVIATGIDITTRKQAEEATKAADLAKSAFLSSMSHELRTPLNAILGFAQVLKFDVQTPLNTKQMDATDHIIKGGEHLLNLINDVLNLSKIEAGNIGLQIEAINTKNLLSECISSISPLYTELNIKIDAENFSGAMVLADRVRLKQVLLNILSNAIKYNRINGSVHISSGRTDQGQHRISITDTGQGIPAHKHKDIFEPFSRLGAENSDIDGTGIGLTITKQLLEAMNGSIDFKSQDGEGATFCIDLPLSKSQTKTQASPLPTHGKQDVHIKVSPRAKAVRGRILYIEDNPTNAMLMETILDDVEGVNLQIAATAELGLKAAQDNPPDLILMDIHLPGMDGYEALQKLKADSDTQNIPVIAISADARPDEIIRGKASGFLDYVTKPFDVPQLITLISETLSLK
ncbi:MAG: hybrid sensor histidine kinase/response regulator [Rhodospirillaceae bacterium]|nr:MAG: hybrid sensor histidine kinase/response regulator [Rhodospirillaceae bacterium]